MNNNSVVAIVIGVIIIPTAIYVSWVVKRNINYAWVYESRVQSTVCEMVKPEYLTKAGQDICE